MQLKKGSISQFKKSCLISMLMILTLSVLHAPLAKGGVNGKVVLIVGVESYYAVNMEGLLLGEGFDVEHKSGGFNDLTTLLTYDAVVFNHYSATIETMNLAAAVSSGLGVFILPSRDQDPIISFAGVVEGDGDGMSTTSRFLPHSLMEGLQSMWVKGNDLSTFSSSAYPLVLGNDVEYGVTDPVLAVANQLGSGKIVLLSQDKYFDNYLGSEDNALFFKNAIYWLTDLDVPSFTRDIPTVFDVEDEIALLNASVDSIAQDLAEIANDIGNISSIDEIAEDVAGLDAGYEEISSSQADLGTDVTLLQEQIAELIESVSGFQEIVDELGDASEIVDLKNRLSVMTSQLEVLENELHSQQPQGGTDLLLYISPVALVIAVIAVALTIKK